MTAEYNYPPPGPKGSRIWGAFWLKSQCDCFNNGTTTRTEIDINEFYGDDGYHVTGHLWPAAPLSPGATIIKHIFCSGYKNKVAPLRTLPRTMLFDMPAGSLACLRTLHLRRRRIFEHLLVGQQPVAELRIGHVLHSLPGVDAPTRRPWRPTGRGS